MGRREEKVEINGQEYVKKKSIKPLIIGLIFIVIVVGVGYLFIRSKQSLKNKEDVNEKVEEFVEEKVIGKEGEVTTISEAQIKEVFEISELQIADYIYNAVTEVRDNDGKLKYHVAYEGTVKAGIDFNAIKISVDDENKKITITVPDVTIQDAIVDEGTLEYIFAKKKYDNEEVFKEAFDICQEDLNNRSANETKLLDLAQENARQVIEAMVAPWVEQINAEYTVEIK